MADLINLIGNIMEEIKGNETHRPLARLMPI